MFKYFKSLLLILVLGFGILFMKYPLLVDAQLPDTTEDIIIYAISQRPDERISSSQIQRWATEFDFLEGNLSPEMIEDLHQKNPSFSVLVYRQTHGLPHAAGGVIQPWGNVPQPLIIPEWQDGNKRENMFLHAANPASLALVPGDGKIDIYWSEDKRGIISDLEFPVAGYNIYRRGVGEQFARINNQPITDTHFTDNNLQNGELYFYKVMSVSADEKEYFYSDVEKTRPISSPPCLLYNQGFSVQFSSGESNDGFHPLPESTPIFEFSASSTCPGNIVLYFDQNKDWKFKDTQNGQEVFPMTEQGGVYQVTVQNAYTPRHGGFAYYFEADYGSVQARLPEINSYTTNINNRIRFRQWGSYVMDASTDAWKNFSLKWAKKQVNEQGYDGIFYDLGTATGGPFGHKAVDAIPLPQIENQEQYSADFIQKKKEMFQAIEQAINPKPLVFNGLVKREEQGIIDITDGGMIECFAHGILQLLPAKIYGYWEESVWKDHVNTLIQTDLVKNKAVLALSKGEATTEEELHQPRLYSLASFLLGKQSKSSFSFGPYSNKKSGYPEYYIKIGEPTQSFNSVDEYYVSDKKVYRRRFTNGLVFVNPSATVTSTAIGLSKTYYKVNPIGGTIEDGGTLEYTQV
ncbi:MAG: hypothetical protein ISS48_04760, partial [Candidatus Aenigmarchaeota archaeon]|nr:hypothetical protein [Candidatus Aenigmarchaeota archaeon]